jgi:hypothetical protein
MTNARSLSTFGNSAGPVSVKYVHEISRLSVTDGVAHRRGRPQNKSRIDLILERNWRGQATLRWWQADGFADFRMMVIFRKGELRRLTLTIGIERIHANDNRKCQAQ